MSRRDASLRQRRYSFADHGNSVSGQRQGKFVIKNNLAQHWTPCWGDGVTVIRPFPAKNPDDPTGQSWDPYRFSAEHGQLGDWFRRYDAVRNFGDPGVTMIIRDPADPTAQDTQMIPAHVIYNAISSAVKAGQDQRGWAALLIGGRNRGAVLPRPSEVYLIQGAIMQHKTEVYNPPRGFAPEEKPLVLELSMGAGTALLAELERVIEGNQAADGDWENMFVNGDPVGLNNGRFITFYKLADGDPRTRQAQQAGGWNAPQQQQGGGRQQEAIGFGCYLEPTFNGIPARLNDFEAQVAAKVQNWDDILWFPTVEEQANLLADKLPPEVIMYAWRDHPEWIPENIRNRAVAAHSVNAPAGGGWQQGWGPGQQGQTAPGVAASGGFGAPPAGGFGAPAQAAQFPQPGQTQFPQGAVPGGFGGAPTVAVAPVAAQFPQGQFPPQGAPPQAQQFAPPQAQQFPQHGVPPQGQFAPQGVPSQGQLAPPYGQFPQGQQFQQPQQAVAPQAAPPASFGAPSGFGAPPAGFGAQQAAVPPAAFPQHGQPQFAPGHDPAQMGQPNYGVPSGPTGGPPPSAPAGGYPTAQGQPPQQSMNWAGQNPMAPNQMGQTPSGFAVPAGQPQQFQQPQQPPQQQQPQYQPPAVGQPMGRAAAALAAAQAAAAAGSHPQG